MENFKEIAEKCLAGELSGTFVLRNNEKRHVSKKNQTIRKDYLDPYSPYIIGNRKYSRCGASLPISNEGNPYDIIDFIPNMQKQIKIDIPEGKVPVMEQTKNGIVITLKDQELTYNRLYQSIYKDDKAISSVNNTLRNDTSDRFLTKINVLRKLTNIRNYFGKSKKCAVFCVLVTLVAIFTPSTDSMLAIYGYKNLYDFVQKNEKIQKLPEKVINLTDKYIEYLDKELQNKCTEK